MNTSVPNSSQYPAVPAVISSHIARKIPGIPTSAQDWNILHKAHLSRLQSAWGGLLSKFGLDGVVIHSGMSALKYSRDDQHWPTIATPHFVHWCPYGETPALLVIMPGSKPKLICETHTSFWEGPAPKLESWDQESFVIEPCEDLLKHRFSKNFAFIGDDIKLALKLGLAAEQCNRDDVLSIADGFRTLKSDYEVASMRVANEIAARGHRKVFTLFSRGDYSEHELHLEYLRETNQTDFSVPYGNIVALGANCGILHHVHYGKEKISGDNSLLVDAGATINGYASDITRTWVKGTGAAASAFRGLVDGVDQIQQQLIEGFTVGRPYEDLHNRAHVLLAGILKESGLVNCSSDEMVSSGLTRLFFPHGLGHSLGIQVHDIGMRPTKPSEKNPYLRNTSTITAGQVVTIEPGLYFIPKLMNDAIEGLQQHAVDKNLLLALMKFGGIRIEDNILATESGPVNLTRDFFNS